MSMGKASAAAPRRHYTASAHKKAGGKMPLRKLRLALEPTAMTTVEAVVEVTRVIVTRVAVRVIAMLRRKHVKQ